MPRKEPQNLICNVVTSGPSRNIFLLMPEEPNTHLPHVYVLRTEVERNLSRNAGKKYRKHGLPIKAEFKMETYKDWRRKQDKVISLMQKLPQRHLEP